MQLAGLSCLAHWWPCKPSQGPAVGAAPLDLSEARSKQTDSQGPWSSVQERFTGEQMQVWPRAQVSPLLRVMSGENRRRGPRGAWPHPVAPRRGWLAPVPSVRRQWAWKGRGSRP